LTFHAYQRMLRINTAFNSIKKGETITNSAFDSGYESLSGFNESYRSIFGAPPTNAKEKSVLNIVRFTTPIGPMFACASRKGVCLFEFTDRRMLETEFKDLCKRLNAVILPGENPHLDHIQSEIQGYFAGKKRDLQSHYILREPTSRNPYGKFFRKFLTEKRVHTNNKPSRLETRKQLELWHQLTDIIELALLSLVIELSVPMEV